VVFDANSLLKLLTHYSDGALPLDGELKSAGVNPYLERVIGLEVLSNEWDEVEVKAESGHLQPLHIRYEGKKVLSWSDRHAPISWGEPEAIEAPKLS